MSEMLYCRFYSRVKIRRSFLDLLVHAMYYTQAYPKSLSGEVKFIQSFYGQGKTWIFIC